MIGGVVIIGTGRNATITASMVIALHSTAQSVGGKVVILPAHFEPKEHVSIVELIEAMPDIPKIEWTQLRQSKRERTHPNEPFYRKLNKSRRSW